MRAYTETDVIFGGSARPADNDVSAVIEPATGAVSLDTHAYEEIAAVCGLFNDVAGAKSVSVQFYESDDASGDISATWDEVGDPVVIDLGTGTTGSVGVAKKNRLEFLKKYASAIATFTIIDPGAGVLTTAQLLLEGRILNRVPNP